MNRLKKWLERIEQFHPHEIELGLQRVLKVAKQLDLLTPLAKVILVGGTNGKGSCVATLESLASLSGLQVGCYTSPHLVKFNERIRINRQEIHDELLLEAFETIEANRNGVALTFFEFTTLAALYCFSKSELDLLVLEIGLGGRLDAVNIVEPNVSIITTIDRDHESWLGNELLSIAREKSGIYRQNSFNLVGDQKSLKLLNQAQVMHHQSVKLAEVWLADSLIDADLARQLIDYRINPHRLLKQNVECAIAAFNHLFPELFGKLNLSDVLRSIQIKGRLQRLCNSPLTLLDVGHNHQSAVNLAEQLNSFGKAKLTIAICGLMADKAIAEFLAALDIQVEHWIFVDLPSERAASAAELSEIYRSINPTGACDLADSVAHAYQQALEIDETDKRILVIGSFVTVAEMLHYYQET